MLVYIVIIGTSLHSGTLENKRRREGEKDIGKIIWRGGSGGIEKEENKISKQSKGGQKQKCRQREGEGAMGNL